MGKIRGTHQSPGSYTQITDLSYASKTLGVTTLGLVGETLKGPAFEPIEITDPSKYAEIFGGTSAERFKDSLYPKYELPYIANSYLKKSDKLFVCRVLGLSGYNAGPAFVITASDSTEDDKKHVVAVLRARGSYKKYVNIGTDCNPINKYDQLFFDCDSVELKPYKNVSVLVKCDEATVDTESGTTIDINALNYGQFTIVAKKGEETVGTYPVSLNPGSKDYIINVLGTKPTEGSAALFVEELYDLRLKELIELTKVNQIDSTVTVEPEMAINAITEPVRDFVKIPYNELKKSNIGQTFVCGTAGDLSTGDTFNGFGYLATDKKGIITGTTETAMVVGEIYQVVSYVDKNTGKKSYVYVQVKDEEGVAKKVGKVTVTSAILSTVNAVNVLAYDAFVCLDENDELTPVVNMSDYHEQFRCASTPWVVSELKGDANNLQVKKLFRFHTISDGTESNVEVKISVANVRPDDGKFDIYVRDFNDNDSNPTILESYRDLTMVPGDNKYIGLQIGTIDGAYEIRSKYVTVEIIENDMTRNCVPCGFLGYPTRDYGTGLVAPTLTYNRIFDEDIRAKRQYFGISDLTGVDVDMLTYKGKNAYTEEYTHGYTHPFHLDSTLDATVQESLNTKITIDGDDETSGITWDCVSVNNVTETGLSPIIGSEQDMEGTIYEDKNVRKFTMCFYGGFDGWDIYRKSRTNTDEFRANKYKGTIVNGYGQTFSKIQNGTQLALEGNCITSDYYAYLAGVNQFEIPEKYVINLFATPGIDYVNNGMLVKDTLDMINEKRGADALYVITTPDKPFGSSDAIDEMYSSEDATDNLESSNIDTYMAATYYPWVKYYDADNNVYINLPVTKDVLRNMADVDNKSFPWMAPAGLERGDVECVKMHFFAKLQDEDELYANRINPVKTFSKEGVKIWGNKTMYTQDTPMNRINTVRLMIYMKKLIVESTRGLIFEPNDTTLTKEFDSIVRPILQDIKANRGITDFRLTESQTPEQMDAHEFSANIFVKPTPTAEYLEIGFTVAPQGVSFDEI